MNPATDHELLLDDVLADGAPAEFRSAVLGETLRLVRRRRQFQQARRTGAVLVVLAGLLALVWNKRPLRLANLEAESPRVAIIRSQPLAASAQVKTQPLRPESLVCSRPAAHVVSTAPGERQLHVIDDGELLSLLAPKPVALVWLAPHSAELVFANPHDRELMLSD